MLQKCAIEASVGSIGFGAAAVFSSLQPASESASTAATSAAEEQSGQRERRRNPCEERCKQGRAAELGLLGQARHAGKRAHLEAREVEEAIYVGGIQQQQVIEEPRGYVPALVGDQRTQERHV